MSRWQKTCGNAFNLAVFSSRKVQGSALGHKRHGRFTPESAHVHVVAHVCFGSKADMTRAVRFLKARSPSYAQRFCNSRKDCHAVDGHQSGQHVSAASF